MNLKDIILPNFFNCYPDSIIRTTYYLPDILISRSSPLIPHSSPLTSYLLPLTSYLLPLTSYL